MTASSAKQQTTDLSTDSLLGFDGLVVTDFRDHTFAARLGAKPDVEPINPKGAPGGFLRDDAFAARAGAKISTEPV